MTKKAEMITDVIKLIEAKGINTELGGKFYGLTDIRKMLETLAGDVEATLTFLIRRLTIVSAGSSLSTIWNAMLIEGQLDNGLNLLFVEGKPVLELSKSSYLHASAEGYLVLSHSGEDETIYATSFAKLARCYYLYEGTSLSMLFSPFAELLLRYASPRNLILQDQFIINLFVNQVYEGIGCNTNFDYSAMLNEISTVKSSTNEILIGIEETTSKQEVLGVFSRLSLNVGNVGIKLFNEAEDYSVIYMDILVSEDSEAEAQAEIEMYYRDMWFGLSHVLMFVKGVVVSPNYSYSHNKNQTYVSRFLFEDETINKKQELTNIIYKAAFEIATV